MPIEIDGKEIEQPVLEEPVVKEDILSTPVDIKALKGRIDTVTAVPTHTPQRYTDKLLLFADTIASPTVKRLYVHSDQSKEWFEFTSGGSGLIGSSTVNDTVSAQDGDHEHFSITIPGGTLGTNGVIKVTIDMEVVGSSAASLGWKAKYGATTILDVGTSAITSDTTRGTIICYIVAGGTSVQNSWMDVNLVKDGFFAQITSTSGPAVYWAHDRGTSSEDSTGDLTFTFIARWGNNVAGTSSTMHAFFVEKVK